MRPRKKKNSSEKKTRHERAGSPTCLPYIRNPINKTRTLMHSRNCAQTTRRLELRAYRKFLHVCKNQIGRVLRQRVRRTTEEKQLSERGGAPRQIPYTIPYRATTIYMYFPCTPCRQLHLVNLLFPLQRAFRTHSK